MGVWILAGKFHDEGDESAVFVCSVSGMAFGPVCASREEAEQFLQAITTGGHDPRELPTSLLGSAFLAFRATQRELDAAAEHAANVRKKGMI